MTIMFFESHTHNWVGRAIKSKKITPKSIRPYQILHRLDLVAYQIALPPFLKKNTQCLSCFLVKKRHLRPFTCVRTGYSSSCTTEDRMVKQLKGEEINLVKVI
ncbi:hypothetical protein CR513_58289, partial [Mucuna pruriens]